MVYKQHWGTPVVVQMVVTLLVTAWTARITASYASVLIIRRDRVFYYRIQMIASLGSLALLGICWALYHVNIYVAILCNVAQIAFTATSYYLRAMHLLATRGQASPVQEKAIVKLALPNFPSTIFYAIQGQITLMLITVFGHGSASVANIGALSRLGQILVFVSQMNPILVEPFFARLPAPRLKRTYLLSATIVVCFAALFSSVAFLFPELFLWVLGPKYSGLRIEVGLFGLSSSISYVNGFLWVVHSARRFVYWWNNIAIITFTVLVQGLFIWKFDLSTVRNVLIFNIASAIVSLLISIACGIYGFWHGPQQMATALETEVNPEPASS